MKEDRKKKKKPKVKLMALLKKEHELNERKKRAVQR